MHKVFPTERERVYAEPFGDQVHLAFVGEKPLWITRRTHVSARYLVGVDHVLFDEAMRNVVRTGRAMRSGEKSVGLEGAIGTAIENKIHMVRDDGSVSLQACTDFDD